MDLENQTTIEVSLLKSQQKSRSYKCSFIVKLDLIDKRFSKQLHKMERKWIEIILLPFALLFNRLYCLISVIISGMLAYY